MKALQLLKYLVFCLSFAMFCYQLSVAVERLMNPPLIEVTEIIDIKDIDPPVITVCPTNQINLIRIKENGYIKRDMILYGTAKIEKKQFLSWGGHLNKTFHELISDIFPNITGNSYPKFHKKYLKGVDPMMIFAPKYGYCLEISDYNINNEISIQVFEPLGEFHVYVTDKKHHSYPVLWFSSQFGELITGLSGIESWYDVQVKLRSRSDPNKKGVCEEYDTNTFADCVKKEVSAVMLPVLQCNPPYLSLTNQCTGYFNGSEQSKIQKYFTDIDLWNNYLMELVAFRPIPPQKKCKKPCLATESTVQLRGKNKPDHPRAMTMSKVNLHFKEEVPKTFKMINYTPYDFLIDSGSSLGLWLGLSIFSLTDLSIDALHYIETKLSTVLFCKKNNVKQ